MYTPLSLKWNMMPFDRDKNQFAFDWQNFSLRKHRKFMLTKRTLFLQKHFLKMDRLLFVIVALSCLYVTEVVSAEGKSDDSVMINVNCRINCNYPEKLLLTDRRTTVPPKVKTAYLMRRKS